METEVSPAQNPPKNAYVTLRRLAIVSTLFLMLAVLFTLLYFNGKSLYDNGL